MQAPAGVGDPSDPVAALQLLRAHHLAVEEAEHERVMLGDGGDERRADAGLGGRERVVRLVLAVDREEARVLAGDADDVAAARRRDLVVRVREAAGERLDLGRAVQLRDRFQDVFERHRSIIFGLRCGSGSATLPTESGTNKPFGSSRRVWTRAASS